MKSPSFPNTQLHSSTIAMDCCGRNTVYASRGSLAPVRIINFELVKGSLTSSGVLCFSGNRQMTPRQVSANITCFQILKAVRSCLKFSCLKFFQKFFVTPSGIFSLSFRHCSAIVLPSFRYHSGIVPLFFRHLSSHPAPFRHFYRKIALLFSSKNGRNQKKRQESARKQVSNFLEFSEKNF